MVPVLSVVLSVLAASSGAVMLYLWSRSRIRVVSQDMVMRGGDPYFARRTGLVGRPDEVVRRSNFFIPVEHKSAACHGTARQWDVAQVLAYCLIVEECIGPVRMGELVYRDATFDIPWNGRNRDYVLSVIHRMRHGSGEKTELLWKCRSCEFKEYCGRG